VATPLSGLIASGAVEAGLLLSMIAAREQAVEALPATMADFVAMMHAGAGALAAVAGGILGASAAERTGLRAAGAGYGLAGVLRNLRAEARQGRCPLPDEVLDAAGLSRAQAEHDPDRVLAAVGPAVRAACLRIMGKPVRWRRQIVAAALPGALARRDALRADAVAARGFGDRLAVLRAAALCVV
jgi:phytoene/squalene synthetase